MRLGVFAAVLSIVAASTASAQGVRCAAFLREHDGSWRSFEPGAILGQDGDLIDIQAGQRFRHGQPSAQDFIARLLDEQCRPD